MKAAISVLLAIDFWGLRYLLDIFASRCALHICLIFLQKCIEFYDVKGFCFICTSAKRS
jgi:hypothetical protein